MADQSVKPLFYALSCPEGAWTARLDEKLDSNTSNLKLHFTSIANGKKYFFQEFAPDQCQSAGSRIEFLNDSLPGDIFVLITEKTEDHNFILVSAQRILKGSGVELQNFLETYQHTQT